MLTTLAETEYTSQHTEKIRKVLQQLSKWAEGIADIRDEYEKILACRAKALRVLWNHVLDNALNPEKTQEGIKTSKDEGTVGGDMGVDGVRVEDEQAKACADKNE